MQYLASIKFNRGTALALIVLIFLSLIAALWLLDRWDIANDSGIVIKPFGVR